VSATYDPREASAVVDPAAATRDLYERHGQRVLTFCLSRLRDAEEAQDGAQTTFLYALRALGNGTRPRFERAWLLAIAHNVCRSTRRSRNRRVARTSFADVTELEAAASALQDDTGEDLVWIRDALERLPESQRRAILLREWQGLSDADMAAELQLTVGAVEALLFRARRSLATQLERSKRAVNAHDLGVVEAVRTAT
jgi:RNA polymerase sigma factor (sigma-70 family)